MSIELFDFRKGCMSILTIHTNKPRSLLRVTYSSYGVAVQYLFFFWWHKKNGRGGG